MCNKRIFLDFDEVLVETINSCIFYYEVKTQTKCDMSKLYQWGMNDIMPLYSSEQIEAIFEDDIFWRILKYKKDAYEFIEKYHDRIIICSNGTLKNLEKKAEFIRRDFPRIKTMLTNCKKDFVDMRGSLFVDDNQHNLWGSNAEYKVCFGSYGFNKEWNSEWSGWKTDRFSDLDDLIKELDNAQDKM